MDRTSTRPGDVGRRQARPGPSEHALARTVLRFAIALRCGGVAAAVAAAAIGDAQGISRSWQITILTGLVAWAAFFSVRALRHGLTFALVAGDVAVVSLALLAQPRLIPVTTVIDETTWAVMLASTSIYVTQLALRPAAGLPLGAAVLASYIVGAPAVTSQVRTLVVQIVVVGAMMELLRSGGHRADANVAERDRERQRAMVVAARRADERHQISLMHDSVLAILTMVASGAIRADSPPLRPGARRALDIMQGFADVPSTDARLLLDIAERLANLAAEMPAGLAVDLTAMEIKVSEPVALAVVGAASEALRNVWCHSGGASVTVHAARRAETVTVEITDQGRGFDPADVPADRQGIRKSIVERMNSVGGLALVYSRPGKGTRVVLRWPDG